MNKEAWVRVRIKLQVVIALLLWCYIIYRAFSIGITQDEAYTYLLAKTNNWRQMAGTANTHWLNTLCIRLFLWLPGPDHVGKLRLLSILTWIVYACSTIKLSREFKNQWLGFVFFITATGNPFLIFYFSLARGYAAACAFIMLALYQTATLLKQQQTAPQKWFYVFLSASVAVFANFSAFYFFIGLTAAYLLLLYLKKNTDVICQKPAYTWLALIIGTSTFAVASLLFIRHNKDLGYGGREHIVDALFGSMVKTFSYLDDSASQYQSGGVAYLLSDHIPVAYRLAGWGIFLLFMLAVLSAAYPTYRTKVLSHGVFALLVCSFIVALNVVLHALFNTPYLMERTVLVLYPPLIAGLLAMTDTEEQSAGTGKYVMYPASGIFLLLVIYNFYTGFSLKSFSDWPVQTNTRACLDYLESLHAKKVGMSVWHHDVFINYYSLAYPGKYHFDDAVIPEKLQAGAGKSQLSGYDYLLICPPHYDSTTLKNWQLALSFPESGARVFKKRIGL